MPQRSAVEFTAAQFATLDRVVRGLVRQLRRLALASAAAVVPIALLLRDDGFSSSDVAFTLLLLAPPAFLLFFAQGVLELISVPDRLRRMPGEGQERVTELTRVAGDARTARLRSLPLLIWRLRGSIGSVRDIAGIALPLRVVTPGFLGLAALGALLCLVIACSGVIALIVLVAG
jgi:hypothetical protein